MKNSVSSQLVFIVLSGSLLMLTGCSDPKNFEVKKLTDEQKQQVGAKLSADEGQKLTAWMIRNAIGGKDVPDGTTIAQALKDQDAWVIKVKEEESKAADLKRRVDAERQAKQAEFSKLLSIAVLSKKNRSGSTNLNSEISGNSVVLA